MTHTDEDSNRMNTAAPIPAFIKVRATRVLWVSRSLIQGFGIVFRMFPGVYRIQADPGRIAGNTTACARARGNFTPATPRKSAHHPSSRVSRTMAEFPCAAAASFPKKIDSQKFIEKPRQFIEFYRIFQKFPRPERAESLRHHTRALPRPVTANAGKYAFVLMWTNWKNHRRCGRRCVRNPFG